MRHVEVAAPWCSVCHLLYVVRAGLSFDLSGNDSHTTGHYEFAWYRDCKCKGGEPEVAVDSSGEPRMFSLDKLCPQQAKRAVEVTQN